MTISCKLQVTILINESDTQMFYYDALIERLLDEDNKYKDLIKLILCIITEVVKRNFRDDAGNIIENKYGYFISYIESNTKKLNNYYKLSWDYDDKFENDFEI